MCAVKYPEISMTEKKGQLPHGNFLAFVMLNIFTHDFPLSTFPQHPSMVMTEQQQSKRPIKVRLDKY